MTIKSIYDFFSNLEELETTGRITFDNVMDVIKTSNLSSIIKQEIINDTITHNDCCINCLEEEDGNALVYSNGCNNPCIYCSWCETMIIDQDILLEEFEEDI